MDRNSTLYTLLITSSDWSIITTQYSIYNEISIRVTPQLLYIETAPDSGPLYRMPWVDATVGSGR